MIPPRNTVEVKTPYTNQTTPLSHHVYELNPGSSVSAGNARDVRFRQVLAAAQKNARYQPSGFSRCVPVTYSADNGPQCSTRCGWSVDGWSIVPLHLEKVRSTLFERLPGPEPDGAFLMAEPKTTWCPQSACGAPP